ncbi:MAG: hypothetical protein OSB09_03620 [Planctomycetota bacterium]|nr:hypothetical protein [Planctomycetota bacterium]
MFVLEREYSYHLERGDQLAWIANYSCCGILWLLHRRNSEPNFLAPNFLQALMAKKLAKRILNALQNRRIEAVNARFSQKHLLKEFIKYIDQQGGQLPAELFEKG